MPFQAFQGRRNGTVSLRKVSDVIDSQSQRSMLHQTNLLALLFSRWEVNITEHCLYWAVSNPTMILTGGSCVRDTFKPPCLNPKLIYSKSTPIQITQLPYNTDFGSPRVLLALLLGDTLPRNVCISGYPLCVSSSFIKEWLNLKTPQLKMKIPTKHFDFK